MLGIPDPKWGERPLALVVAKPEQTVDEATIRAWLKTLLIKALFLNGVFPTGCCSLMASKPASASLTKAMREQYSELIRG